MAPNAAVEPCRVVGSADDLSWDEEADLVIVGFGGVGMCVHWGLAALINIALGKIRRAATLATLGKKCGIDTHSLENTVAQYNRDVAENRTDPLGKQPVNCAVLGGAAASATTPKNTTQIHNY